MHDDFSKYEAMRTAGLSAERVYQEAVRDGIDPITRIRLIRKVFTLSLGQAKDVILRAEGAAESSEQLQGKIAEMIQGGPLDPTPGG